jgi:hypothetical protein
MMLFDEAVLYASSSSIEAGTGLSDGCVHCRQGERVAKRHGQDGSFGALQPPDFAALGTLMNREEKQQTAAGSLPEIDRLYGWR